MTTKRGARPDYLDVLDRIDGWKSDSRADISVIGQSPEGRDIPCVTMTDPAQASEDKQRAIIIAGQHGSEESGRAIALALIDFLLGESAEANELIQSQEIAVIPCCNPDGAQEDSYHNTLDVNTAHVFHFDRDPETSDALALWRFIHPFNPELFIDIHGLAGGSMSDRVWTDAQLGFSVNSYFMTLMAARAKDASEALGYPTCEPKVPVAMDPQKSHRLRPGEKLSWAANTLSFGVEAIEQYYCETEWVEAGLARIKTLLSYGSTDAFGLGRPGYPNQLISGHRICGLMAHGRNAAERRENRAAITAFLRQNMAVVDRGSDGIKGHAAVRVTSETTNGEQPDRFAVRLRFRQPFTLKSVSWDGRELDEGDEHGYRMFEGNGTTELTVGINEPFGGPERRLIVEYDSPWLSRDTDN